MAFLLIELKIQHLKGHLCGLYKHMRSTASEYDWSPFQPKCYITLAFIHYKGMRTRKEVLEVAKETRQGNIDQIIKRSKISSSDIEEELDGGRRRTSSGANNLYRFENTNTTKDISDIFEPIEVSNITDGFPHTILFEGAPGIGKTILSVEIAYQWATGRLLKGKLLLFYLPLRDPAVQQINSIKELIQYVYHNDGSTAEISDACARYLVQNGGSDVVIILDGYDEFPKSRKGDSFITNVILHKILPNCCVVITSRPFASASLHGKVSCRVDILGFTDSERNSYIQYALQDVPDQVPRLLNYLQEHKAIDSLCYIPLNMAILLCLFKEDYQLPENQTDLHRNFTFFTIFHHLKKAKMISESWVTYDIKSLPKPNRKVIWHLSKLAYMSLEENKIIFSYNDLKNACPNVDEIPGALNGFGLLQAVQHFSFSNNKHETSLNFLHYSIQEFLAAFYISSLNSGCQVALLKSTFWNENYFNAWIMYVGLNEGNCLAFKHYLSNRKYLLFSRLFGPSSIAKQFTEDKIKCFYLLQVCQESNNESLINQIGGILETDVIDFSYTCLLRRDLNIFGCTLARCNKWWSNISLCNCNIGNDEMAVLYEALSSSDGHCKAHINSIDLSYNHLTSAAVEVVSGLTQQCHTTRLCVSHNSIDEEIDTLISHTTLIELDASYNTLNAANATAIFNALEHNDSLRTLYLKECNISSEAADHLANALAVNSTLECIDISNSKVLNLSFGFEKIKHNKSLKKFCLNGVIASARDAESVSCWLKFNRNLQTLRLTNSEFKRQSLFTIYNGAIGHPSLRQLTIGRYHLLSDQVVPELTTPGSFNDPFFDGTISLTAKSFLPKDIHVLVQVITSFHNMQWKRLDLHDSNFGDAECKLLLAALESTEQHDVLIEAIDLSCNYLTCSCIKSLASLVQLCNTTKLNISHNFIDSSIAVLITSTKLFELDISYNMLEITGDTAPYIDKNVRMVKKLADILSITTTLETINISGCIMSKDYLYQVVFAIACTSGSLKTLQSDNYNLLTEQLIPELVPLQQADFDDQLGFPDVINFSHKAFLPKDIQVLCSTITLCNEYWKMLDLSGSSFGDAECKILCKMLTCMLGSDACRANIESIDLSNNGLTASSICSLLCLAKHFRTTKLYLSCNFLGVGAATLVSDARLEELDLSNNNLQMQNIVSLFQSLSGNTSLKVLHFRQNSIDLEGTNALVNSLATNTTLEVLDVSNCTIRKSNVYKVAFFAITTGTMKQLKYNNYNLISDQAIGKLKVVRDDPASIQKLCSSNVVDFRNQCFLPLDILVFSNIMEIQFIHWEKLDLSGCHFTDEGCVTVYKALLESASQNHCNICIKSIDLSQNGLTPSCIDSLIGLIQHCKTSKLRVSHNSLGDTIATLIKDTLLTELDVSYNTFNILPIANAVKESLSLQTLHMTNDSLIWEEAFELADAISSNSVLQKLIVFHSITANDDSSTCGQLNVSYNKLRSAETTEIVKALTNKSSPLQVINLHTILN